MARVLAIMAGALCTVLFALLTIVAASHLQTWDTPPSPGIEPPSGSVARGRAVYVRSGCVYCHSQQVRDRRFNDIARGWGPRPSQPGDYVHDKPHLLGTMRTGPDLHDVGSRLPSRDWHLLHLYRPNAVVAGSIMPPHPFLFELADRDALDPAERQRRVAVPAALLPPGRVLLASDDASALVDYLLSLTLE